MKKKLAIVALLALSFAGAAHALGLGLGTRVNKLGAYPLAGTLAPLVPCTSTGIFDLGNVCNDIYFIGGLK